MAIQTLYKQPSESRVYAMDFTANMDVGDTITSVLSIVTTPAGLTNGTPAPSGKSVAVRLSGGTNNVQYKMTLVVQTALGSTLEGEGYLLVTDI